MTPCASSPHPVSIDRKRRFPVSLLHARPALSHVTGASLRASAPRGRTAVILFLISAACLFFSSTTSAKFDPSFVWTTLETPHFFIHYHQGGEETAKKAAVIAEDVHARSRRGSSGSRRTRPASCSWTPWTRRTAILPPFPTTDGHLSHPSVRRPRIRPHLL